MSKKKTFVTLEQLKEIDKTYPTPYHLYDEKGIRDNARRLKEAFAWNKGYREYFAVKAGCSSRAGTACRDAASGRGRFTDQEMQCKNRRCGTAVS